MARHRLFSREPLPVGGGALPSPPAPLPGGERGAEPHLRRVWDGLAAGQPVRATALALAKSRAQVKRWHVEVDAILAGALGGWAGSRGARIMR